MTKSMNDLLKIPPKNKYELTPPQELAQKLAILIGQPFPLTRKTRTEVYTRYTRTKQSFVS